MNEKDNSQKQDRPNRRRFIAALLGTSAASTIVATAEAQKARHERVIRGRRQKGARKLARVYQHRQQPHNEAKLHELIAMQERLRARHYDATQPEVTWLTDLLENEEIDQLIHARAVATLVMVSRHGSTDDQQQIRRAARQLLASPSWLVRQHACALLAECQDTASLERLAALEHDPAAQVRDRAARAIVQIRAAAGEIHPETG